MLCLAYNRLDGAHWRVFTLNLGMSKKKKWFSVLVIVVVAAGAYYFLSGNQTEEVVEIRQTATVERGLLVSSVSGTGQVQVSDSVDLKPGASSTVTAIYVNEGDEVKKGDLLVRLDATDVARDVRDAENDLEDAREKLEELYDPLTELETLQKQNTLTGAQESVEDAIEDLESGYEDGYDEVTSVFLDLPDIMSDLDDLLYGTDVTDGQSNVDAYFDLAARVGDSPYLYKEDALDKYESALELYEENFQDYKLSSRFDEREDVEALMNQTYTTVLELSEAVRAISNFIDYVEGVLTEYNRELPSVMNTHQNTLGNLISSTTSMTSSVKNRIEALQTARDKIVSAERSLQEKELETEEFFAGPEEDDIEDQQRVIELREEDLADARAKYADYVIFAPFDGIVAEVGVTVGEDAGSGTTAITLVTDQHIAEISFNEVDVTGIEVGQKADIEFDAIDDYSLTGEVAAVDLLGSANQGVVTFDVTVAFDTEDERVKPGMSLSVSIVTDVREDVLTVSNSAIKYQGNTPYVEVMNNGTAEVRTVTLGVSNDLKTEVVDGLEEGEEYVSSSTSGTDSSSIRGGGFMVPGMGGMMR